MLLTITYKGNDTTKLGFLLHKNPYRPQKFELKFGDAYVFYPEISDKRTTAAMLLDINPVNLARGKEGANESGLFDYVNDRPYVASSFMSVAVSNIFRTAMSGRCEEHQELCGSSLDLEAAVAMLPCRSDAAMLNRVFEPLGYEVKYESFLSDESFPDWGESRYVNLKLKAKVKLCDLLKHIYILIPVFDRQKHYWIGNDEVEKLMRNAGDWLSSHPEKEFITSRYLKRMNPLVNLAFARLSADSQGDIADEAARDDEESSLPAENPAKLPAEQTEKKLNLNAQRLGSVVAALKNCRSCGGGNFRVRSVIDIGCGEGNLLRMLLKEKQFERIAGADVSPLALERAFGKLKLDSASDNMRERISLFQSSLTYKDLRFKGFDAVCVIEVIEHLDLSRLSAFERVLFGFTKPRFVILTTPNREYNEKYENIGKNNLRHADHRFEWTREEFRNWADKTADRYGYTVKYSEIGETYEVSGGDFPSDGGHRENYSIPRSGAVCAPTQMGVFTLCE